MKKKKEKFVKKGKLWFMGNKLKIIRGKRSEN